MWLTLLLIGTVSFIIYKFLKPSDDSFWRKYGVREINNSTIKDQIDVFRGLKTLADLDEIAYKELGDNGKFCGVYEMSRPMLLVKDLDILKKILIKDFEYFTDRRVFGNGDRQKILNKAIGNLTGEEWKGVRSSLSPTFTTGKIRRMMEIINTIGSEWIQNFKDKLEKSGQDSVEVDVVQETTSYTVDVIAAAVFGMNGGTIKNPNSHFSYMATRLTKVGLPQMIKFGVAFMFPKIIKLLNIAVFDEGAISYFENILSQGMKERERMNDSVKRNDFIQLLTEARKGGIKAVGKDELSQFEKDAQITGSDKGEGSTKKNWLKDDDICNAQMIGFFFAGFSTTSSFIGLTLYMLALYPEYQQKLREELDSQLFSNSEGDEVDYDQLNKLVYLDMFVNEVLRKFPTLGRIERICTKDYNDPTENLRVPKGTLVGIPVQSIHNDKRYYEHPDKFYPEHFSAESKAKRSPYCHIPFGVGGRNCIGMRFALVESKAAIAKIVHNFIIEPTAKTPIPFVAKNVGLGVQTPDGLEVKFKLAK